MSPARIATRHACYRAPRCRYSSTAFPCMHASGRWWERPPARAKGDLLLLMPVFGAILASTLLRIGECRLRMG
jgi:hypothetical protein